MKSVDQNQINVLPLDCLVTPETSVRVNPEFGLEALAESIGSDGLLEPLVVRPSKREAGKFEVVCGLRRFLAAQKAGLKAVPCVVKEMSDVEAMEAMFIENKEREDLTDYEVGRWFKLLMEKYPDKYPNVVVVAKRFGFKDHAIVSRLINHYQAVEELKKALPPNIVPRGTMLPEGVVREIRRADPEHWVRLVKAYFKSLDEGKPLGVAGIAALVDGFCRRLPEIKKEKPKPPEAPPEEKPPEKEEEKPAPKPEEPTVEVEKPVEPEVKPKVEPEVKPEPVEEEEVVEKVLEEERQRVIAERELKRKLDKAGRTYLTLINYYPDNFVTLLEKFGDLGSLSEGEAVKLARGVLEVFIDEVTDYGKKVDVFERAVQIYMKWR